MLASPGDPLPRIDIAWNTNLAYLHADEWSGHGCRPIAMRDTDLAWATKIVGVLGADRMPIDAVGRNRYFRHQIGTCQGDALRGEPAQRNMAYHAVLVRDLPGVEETAELLGLGVGRDGRRQSHAKSFGASTLDASPRARPCAHTAMAVVPRRCRAIEADLQAQAVARQRAQRFRRPVNSMPLVRTVVGAAAAHAVRIPPMSASRKGSPPVTKISLTPSSAASLAIR